MTEHIMPEPKPAYSAVIKQDGAWWIGWIEEIPGVNCQEESEQELRESLRETLEEGQSLGFLNTQSTSSSGK